MLKQLVVLEKHGKYHGDLRLRNIIEDEGGNYRLIDFGAISLQKWDCKFPNDQDENSQNIFLMFIVLIDEMTSRQIYEVGARALMSMNNFDFNKFKEPFASYIFKFISLPQEQWSFEKLQDVFKN